MPIITSLNSAINNTRLLIDDGTALEPRATVQDSTKSITNIWSTLGQNKVTPGLVDSTHHHRHCRRHQEMFLEHIRCWCRDLCQKRVAPLISSSNLWKRVSRLLPGSAPPSVRPHILQSRSNKPHSLPFAGNPIRNETLGLLIKRAFTLTWLPNFSRLCVGAGLLPLSESRGTVSTYMLHLEPPQLKAAGSEAVEGLREYSRAFNAWSLKLQRFLQSLEKMGAIIEMPSSDQIKIANVKENVLVAIIDSLKITGLSMSLIATRPSLASQEMELRNSSCSLLENSSYSALSLVFPLLRSVELDAFSDFSSMDLSS